MRSIIKVKCANVGGYLLNLFEPQQLLEREASLLFSHNIYITNIEGYKL